MQAAGDRLLATRIQLDGATNLHEAFINDPEKWANEIRSCGIELAADRLWIEQVRFCTRPTPMGLEERLAQNDAVADLLRIIQKTEPAPEIVNPLIDELAGLRAKLPRELADEVDALNLQLPEMAVRVLEDVKNIIISRLTSIGGAQ